MPSQKVLDEKKKIVDALASEFKQAQSIVLAEYRGLTVEQDTAMRAEMRKAQVQYKVVKNTLSRRAMNEAGIQGIDSLLNGPTAIAYSKQDVIAAAKILKGFADKFEQLNIKGGVVDGKMVSVEDVGKLAMIPGRDVLYGQVVYSLAAPIAGLAMILNMIREKMSGETGAEEAVPAETAAV